MNNQIEAKEIPLSIQNNETSEKNDEKVKKEKDYDDKYLEQLYKAREYSVSEFDKGITLISTGIFGISFAFIEKIVDLKNKTSDSWLLIYGWTFLAISIVLSVTNHFVNMRILDRYIKIFRTRKEKKHVTFKKMSNTIIHSINITTILLTIAGSLFILFFINKNMPSK
jgi:hypothetical protein